MTSNIKSWYEERAFENKIITFIGYLVVYLLTIVYHEQVSTP
jgi:hypothetical protein